MSTQIREIVRLLNEPPFSKNLSLCVAPLPFPPPLGTPRTAPGIIAGIHIANRFGLALRTEIVYILTPRNRERAPQGRFLLKRGVRTCAADKMYSSPTPFDSPCYHGPISPTVVSSERFWNAQSIPPGHRFIEQ